MFSRPDFDTAVSDITALLADHDPAAAGQPDDGQARMLRIRQQITSQPQAPARRRSWWPRRPQRRRRQAVIIGLAVPALLGASAAGWAIAQSPPASYVTNTVICFTGKYDPGGDLDHSGGFVLTASAGVPATQVCAHLWATGGMGLRRHFVPPLTACVLPPGDHPGAVGENGAVGVFPDATCSELRLAPLPPGYQRAARHLAAMERYLVAGKSRCRSLPAADQYARQALAKFGYEGWRITHPWGTGPVGGLSGCWGGQTDSAVHVIQVLPQPPGPLASHSPSPGSSLSSGPAGP